MQDNPYAPPPPEPLGLQAVPDPFAAFAADADAAAHQPAGSHMSHMSHDAAASSQTPPAVLELSAAIDGSIHPCTALTRLGIPERTPLLADWFYEGDLGFVFAPRGLGKTWLSLGLATAIASGTACGPWQAAGARRVLYVDGEMPCSALGERIAGMGGTDNLQVLNHEALFVAAGQVLNLADPAIQSVLTGLLLARGVSVLFLDNLSCLFSGVKENDADSWGSVLPWLLTLRRHRIAVVVVHHSGRNLEMRGTSRREDAAFWVIRLETVQGEEREGARFVSRFTKDRNSREEQRALDWNFRTGADGRVEIVTKPVEGADVLRQWIEDGLTSAEDIAREMGLSKGMVSRLAKRAMEEGWLCKSGREYALVK